MKYLYRYIKLLLFIFFTGFCLQTVRGQITVQIGTGNDAPTSGTQYSPLYRFSAGSVATNSRSDILFTQAELTAAGIPAGATIISVQFNKLNANNFLIPTRFYMLMNNSSNTALDPNIIDWTTISGAFTSVYSDTIFNIPPSPGWMKWNLQTPFVYNGGALEIATDNTMTPGSSGATGNIAWEWTASTPISMVVGNTNFNSFAGGQAPYRQRPNIKITYYPPQMTPQIGTGNDAPTSGTQYSPLYRFSAGSVATNSRSDILFTQAELSAAGIPAGATITSVQFNKLNANNFLIPTKFYMLMNNSSNTALDPNVIDWTTISNSFTSVYSDTLFNVPASSGWVRWNLQAPFLYNGGALEIATDNTMTPGITGATGNIPWEWTASTPISMVVGNTNLNPFTGGQAPYRQRPNIKISYYPPACATPSAPVVSNITNITADVNWNTVSGAVGYQYAVTTSPTLPASGTDVTSNSVNVTGLTPVTQYYVHVRTNCGSGYSLFWSTTAFNTLEACPKPSTPVVVINNSSGAASISWNPSPFGAFGYEYALTTSANPPVSGTATTSTNFQATGLTGSAQYYIHVRADCSAQGFSPWVTKGFISPCFTPIPTVVANIKSGMAEFSWQSTAGTRNYEYAITTAPADPTSGTVTNDTVYHTAGLNGGTTYYFHVRSYCGTGVSSWATVAFNTLGMEAYPNPVKEILQINLHGVSNANGQITIGDALGRIVKKLQLIGNSATVDTRGWAAGMYLIRYDDGKNKYTIRIMKQ
jgi:Secretion system C-terminal sorting domain/Fibronectin type III domain